MDLQPRASFEQQDGELDREYAWFKHYADTFGERDIARTARSIGVSVKLLRDAAARNQWDARCIEFDRIRAQVTGHIAPDDSEALQTQYMVGIAMMRLGVQAIQLKNPSLLKVKQILDLMTQGAEMARRGAGVADIKIEKTVQRRIESEFLDLLGD